MMILFDKPHFVFKSYLGIEGHCHLKVVRSQNPLIDIVIFTNPLNYTGPSVTNCIEKIIEEFEKIAKEVYCSFNELSMRPISLYLERYADTPNEFTWVSLNDENKPSWKKATPEETKVILKYLEQK